jgi:hypothetical protein
LYIFSPGEQKCPCQKTTRIPIAAFQVFLLPVNIAFQVSWYYRNQPGIETNIDELHLALVNQLWWVRRRNLFD